MKLSFAKKTVGLGAALLLAGQANAALINDWEWTLDSGWTAATPNFGGDITTDVIATNPVTDINGNPIGYAVISWGTDDVGNTTQDNPSSLTVVNPNLDTTNMGNGGVAFALTETAPGSGVYSDTVLGTQFIHHNNPIFDPFATEMTLTDLFQLYPTNPMYGDDINSPTAVANPSFNWTFRETPNNDATCWAEIGNGPFDYQAGNPCPDVMVLANTGPLQFSFSKEGYIYTVSVGAVGVGPLPQAACDAVAPGLPGCFGLITQENQDNPFQFVINLTAKVPEPSILALLGVGLLGFGFRRRSKK